MLQTEHPSSVRNYQTIAEAAEAPESLQSIYQSVLDFVRRQYPVIAFAAMMFALGASFMYQTTPATTLPRLTCSSTPKGCSCFNSNRCSRNCRSTKGLLRARSRF